MEKTIEVHQELQTLSNVLDVIQRSTFNKSNVKLLEANEEVQILLLKKIKTIVKNFK